MKFRFFKRAFVMLAAIAMMYPTLLFTMEQPSPRREPRKIKQSDISPKIKLDKKGFFVLDDKEGNSSSVIHFLENAATQNKAPQSLKKIKKAVALNRETSKYANDQLFLVINEKGKKYILKEIKPSMKPGEEIKRLDRAFFSLRLEPYIFPQDKDKLSLSLPRAYLSYIDSSKQKHTLVLMPKAKGDSLQSVMEKFKENPNATIDLACQAYYDLGRALAKFYQTYGPLDKTIVHGDLHAGNIFYDPKTGLTTLIDNERIAYSLEGRKDISKDLGHLAILSPCIVEYGKPEFLKKIDLKRWYNIILPSFIIGFIRAYPKEKRAEIFKKVKDSILKWGVDERATNTAHKYGIDKIIKSVLYMLDEKLIKEGKTELHIAAGNCDLTKVLDIIIQEGTKAINAQDNDGNLPLHEAAYFGCKRSAELLLKAGSKLQTKNKKGETPLFKAQYGKHKGVEEFLKKKGC